MRGWSGRLSEATPWHQYGKILAVFRPVCVHAAQDILTLGSGLLAPMPGIPASSSILPDCCSAIALSA